MWDLNQSHRDRYQNNSMALQVQCGVEHVAKVAYHVSIINNYLIQTNEIKLRTHTTQEGRI